MSKIIEVTPEINRRLEIRRKSDLSDRQKAERFDALMVEAQRGFDFFTKLLAAHPEQHLAYTGGCYEGAIAAYRNVLAYQRPTTDEQQCAKIGGGQ